MSFPKAYILCSFLFSFVTMNAQKSVEFEMQVTTDKVQGGYYNKIRFIDCRDDTSKLGIVRMGPFKERTLVVAKKPLADQIQSVMQAITDSTSQNRTMLFQLRHFVFLEYPGVYSDKGFFYLKASLYYQQEGQYRKIKTIDTLLETYGSTYILYNEASRVINNFIVNNLWQVPEKETLSYNNLLHIDSVEKSKLIAYAIPVLKDGMYRSFKSFVNQQPDMEVIVERKGNRILSVKTDDGDGGTFGVKLREIYALVDKGQAFIVNEKEYCPMNRINGDFYFTGLAGAGADAVDVIGFVVFFGGWTNPVTNDKSKKRYDLKLDHRKGTFIRLRPAR